MEKHKIKINCEIQFVRLPLGAFLFHFHRDACVAEKSCSLAKGDSEWYVSDTQRTRPTRSPNDSAPHCERRKAISRLPFQCSESWNAIDQTLVKAGCNCDWLSRCHVILWVSVERKMRKAKLVIRIAFTAYGRPGSERAKQAASRDTDGRPGH